MIPITETPTTETPRRTENKNINLRRMNKSCFLCVSVSLWWVLLDLCLHLPQDLPHEGKQDLRVVGPEVEPANQAAEFLFTRCR